MTNIKNISEKMLKFQKEATFSTTVLLTVGIIAVLNFFASQLFFRLDLTKNKDYSISAVTKDVVKNLDDVITIKTYFSENTPTQFIQVKRDVNDILEAYQNYSGGKIKIENIDPAKDPAMKSELQAKGIPEVQFNDYAKDKLQVINGYMGMSIEYGDKSEVFPVIQDTNNFEYQMTTKLKKLTETKSMTIGYVTSNGTASMDQELKGVVGNLKSLYEVIPVELTGKTPLPKDISALIIAAPTVKFGDAELKKLDGYLMSGGSLAIYANGVTVDQSMQPKINDVGLNRILEKYGIKLNNDLIIDSQAGIASFNQGFMTFNVQYPYWPRLTKDSFSKTNPAVAKLNNVTLPWASSISFIDQDKSQTNRDVLAHTSVKSSTVSENFNLNPQQDYSASNFSEQNVAVLLSGKIKSAFGKGETDKGRLLLVSDGDFLRDSFIQNSADNANLFSNTIDSLALDQNFASIRAKGVTNHPIKSDLTDGEKAAYRYLNIFGLTALVMAYGLYRYAERRRKKQEVLA